MLDITDRWEQRIPYDRVFTWFSDGSGILISTVFMAIAILFFSINGSSKNDDVKKKGFNIDVKPLKNWFSEE